MQSAAPPPDPERTLPVSFVFDPSATDAVLETIVYKASPESLFKFITNNSNAINIVNLLHHTLDTGNW